jgi:hypothetical protein
MLLISSVALQVMKVRVGGSLTTYIVIITVKFGEGTSKTYAMQRADLR